MKYRMHLVGTLVEGYRCTASCCNGDMTFGLVVALTLSGLYLCKLKKGGI